LRTELGRHTELDAATTLVANVIVYQARLGAYTELFAGLSSQLTIKEDQGGWVVPWGRRNVPMRDDILAEAQKEKGKAYQIYDWCDSITAEWQ
jgi:retinol dehydrogenase 12